MLNLTPKDYVGLYDIYPNRATVDASMKTRLMNHCICSRVLEGHLRIWAFNCWLNIDFSPQSRKERKENKSAKEEDMLSKDIIYVSIEAYR